MKKIIFAALLLLYTREAYAGNHCVFTASCESVEAFRIHKISAPPSNQVPPGNMTIEKYFGFVALNESGFEELIRLIGNCDKPEVAILVGNIIMKKGPSQAVPPSDKWIMFSRDTEEEVRSLLHDACPGLPIQNWLDR